MRILVISDVHANYRGLKAVIDKFHNVDEIWCLGDTVEYGPSPSKCIELVRQYCKHVVRGNHEDSFVNQQPTKAGGWSGWFPNNTTEETLNYIRQLPSIISTEADGISYCLVHGSPRNHSQGILNPYADQSDNIKEIEGTVEDRIAAGHSHMAMKLEVGGKLVVNPGTIGQPWDGDYRAQCMLIEDGEFRFERVEYSLHALKQDYIHSKMDQIQAKTWFDYTRTGIVNVHGLRIGPFTPRQKRISLEIPYPDTP